MDTDTELDALISGHIGVARCHGPLHLDRATYRVDNAGELYEESVPSGLDDAATMFSNLRVA